MSSDPTGTWLRRARAVTNSSNRRFEASASRTLMSTDDSLGGFHGYSEGFDGNASASRAGVWLVHRHRARGRAGLGNQRDRGADDGALRVGDPMARDA